MHEATKTVTRSADTKRTLLDAAERVVLRDGGMGLTLDAVARAAGVSKGGLLYHFPTKDALIGGMIDSAFDRFDAVVEALMRADTGPQAGRWLRAYVRANFAPDPHDRDLAAALTACVANDLDAIKPKLVRFAQWQACAEADGLDPALATIITLAVDGVWSGEVFGIAPLATPLREQVRERLLRLANGEEEA